MATLATSNLHYEEWGEAFSNRLLGAATLDRLRRGAYLIVLEGDSYRAPRDVSRPPTKTTVEKGKEKAEK